MIIRVASDLHLEWSGYSFIELPEDKDSIAVLAGDVVAWAHGLSYRGLSLLLEMSKQFRAVVYVFGNHEFYHKQDIVTLRDTIRSFLKDNNITNIHVLEDQCVVYDDVAFIGSTLWTDYDHNNPTMKVMAPRFMADYHQIAYTDRFITPNDLHGIHLQSRHYIFDECKRQQQLGNKTVIVTHHGITPQSIHRKYTGDPYNCNFVSDLTDEIVDANPTLMIHGHVHDPFDYMVDPSRCQTRVVVNPRGYVPHEDNGHDLCLQVEV